jgi:4-hydroxybenzoate polyprenyltransferase
MQRIRTWARALRWHQWSKNVLIFIPLFVGHAYGDTAKIATAVAAFVILCLLASANYVVNDILDREADRRHPSKHRRPFASGQLSVTAGYAVAGVMGLVSLAAAFYLSLPFLLSLIAYLALMLLYSALLRRLPLIDVLAIAILFSLRILMGTLVIGLEPSPWLQSFSLCFFLSPAFAKRHAELVGAVGQEKNVSNRGYHREDWPLTLAFGISTGMASIVIMLLYLANDAMPSGYYGDRSWLYVIPLALTAWLMRIWLLAQRGEFHTDPVIFALTDITSLGLGLATAGAFCLAL